MRPCTLKNLDYYVFVDMGSEDDRKEFENYFKDKLTNVDTGIDSDFLYVLSLDRDYTIFKNDIIVIKNIGSLDQSIKIMKYGEFNSKFYNNF